MITIDSAELYRIMLIFIRAAGLMALIPIFSGATLPVMMRVALSGFLALFVWQVAGDLGPVPPNVVGLVRAGVHEMLVGLLMGLASRLLFYGLEMAGQVISSEIGLSLANTVDPVTHQQTTPFNTLLFYFGANMFLLTGADHACIVAFARSFEVFPPTAAFDAAIADRVVSQTGRIFNTMLQVSAPIVAVNFLVNLALAALGRSAPSLEVFSSSFAIRIFAGLVVFGLSLTLTAQHVLSELQSMPETMLRFLR